MFVKVVIDINHKAVDRGYTYRVPDALSEKLMPGMAVKVPFGKGDTLRRAYVLSLQEETDLSLSMIKEVHSIDPKASDLQEQLMSLAIWMRERYGGTLVQSIATVLPSKVTVQPKKERTFVFTGTDEELQNLYETAVRKKHYAKARLLKAFLSDRRLPAEIAADRLNITMTVLKPFIEAGLLTIEYKDQTVFDVRSDEKRVKLNEEQLQAVMTIEQTDKTVSLLHGITGSGKTEVYLRLIEDVLKQGKQAIVLIPEIALTFQTVMRFYDRFGEQVSVVHSRLSKGEKCERFRKAEAGDIRVMIGPRSALFTPFSNLGLIIIDEFHEASYISEQVPRYNAIEVAEERAKEAKAKVVLGSATPLVEARKKADLSEYEYVSLKKRAVSGAVLPRVHVVDLREELRKGNRRIFSGMLLEKMEDRLAKHEQIILFLNRRGFSGAVSCRECGEAIMCPHCSVPLHYHRNGTLQCHICGHVKPVIKQCPSCGSTLIGTFGTGTEKVEEAVKKQFPSARVLRMDADTTKGKDGHREILEKFMHHEADILVGTQMIVKGHDFPDVTLVGILAADLSLNVPDYMSSERTFQLLTQAEGRAGRGMKPGECVVQTYMPEHYAVKAASEQNYEAFYEKEMIFRRAMKYPPYGYMMQLQISSQDPDVLHEVIQETADRIRKKYGFTGTAGNKEISGNSGTAGNVEFLGPAEAEIYKVKDMYREVFYFKAGTLKTMLLVKSALEEITGTLIMGRKIFITFT